VVILGRVEQPIDSVGEVPQDRQLGQVLQHPPQVVTFGLRELLPTLHDQMRVLEHERRLLLDRQAGLGLGPLSVSLLLPPGPAPPARRRSQPPHRIEHQFVDLLNDVEDAQLSGFWFGEPKLLGPIVLILRFQTGGLAFLMVI
jgi:hypothetical protein